jgi:hypothetical protein
MYDFQEIDLDKLEKQLEKMDGGESLKREMENKIKNTNNIKELYKISQDYSEEKFDRRYGKGVNNYYKNLKSMLDYKIDRLEKAKRQEKETIRLEAEIKEKEKRQEEDAERIKQEQEQNDDEDDEDDEDDDVEEADNEEADNEEAEEAERIKQEQDDENEEETEEAEEEHGEDNLKGTIDSSNTTITDTNNYFQTKFTLKEDGTVEKKDNIKVEDIDPNKLYFIDLTTYIFDEENAYYYKENKPNFFYEFYE